HSFPTRRSSDLEIGREALANYLYSCRYFEAQGLVSAVISSPDRRQAPARGAELCRIGASQTAVLRTSDPICFAWFLSLYPWSISCGVSLKRQERSGMCNIFNAEQNGVGPCLCRRASYTTILINSVSK